MCRWWYMNVYVCVGSTCMLMHIIGVVQQLLEVFHAGMQSYFLMGVTSSGVGVGVITWSADVRGAMATVQLSALVFPFLSLSVICLSLLS